MADVLDLDNSEEFEDTERQVIARGGDEDMDDEGMTNLFHWKIYFCTCLTDFCLEYLENTRKSILLSKYFF